MNKKLVLIIAVVTLVVAAAATFFFLSFQRGMQASEEDEFLPSASKVDTKNLTNETITIYLEARENRIMTEVLQAVNEKLKSEIKTELGFKMIWEYPDSYLDRVRSIIAGGDACDAFYYSSYFEESLTDLAKEGIAADLTKDFPKYAPEYFAKFSGDLSAISENGKIYAVPYNIPSAYRPCVMVRDDLMAKYNIPAIKNYDDYEVYLKTIKEKEPQLIPMDYWDTTIGLFAQVNGYVILDYEMGLVYKWNDPEMKLSAWEQTPGFADGLKRIKSWYDKEYLLKSVGISQIDENIVTSGKWASLISNLGDEFTYNSFLVNKGITDYRFVACPLFDGISPRNSPMQNGIVVNAKSNKIDRVLMFINWLQSKQANYDLLMYGVEGKHYTLKEDYLVPAETDIESDSIFQWGWRAPFQNIDYERVNYTGLKDLIKDYNTIIREKTQYPPSMGFKPDYSPVEDIVTLRRMGYSSMDQKVYTGTFSQEDLDTFIKEQKDNGVDRFVVEIQKQLDNYRNGKK